MVLSPYRVLELASVRTPLCGQMLGDLGADVIVIEPPGSSQARRLGPFYEDRPDLNCSLWWWAFNRNKRAITLDIETADGRELLRRLVEHTDFLVEGFDPGYLEGLGLGYGPLAEISPRLVMTSITPFGQSGPKASYADSDIVLMAATGVLAMTGDEDRAPLRMSTAQAYLHAAAEGAVGALVAHYERERSGRGQHMDVSAQAAVMMATQSYALQGGWGGAPFQRASGGLRLGPLHLRLLFPCADGHVSITLLSGSAIGPATARLMEWMCEEGFIDQATTRDKDWVAFGDRLLTGQEPVSELLRVTERVEVFCRAHTKRELYEEAQRRGVLLAPAATMEDVVESPQLEARGYWVEVEHPELSRSFTYPGPFVKLSETPLHTRRRPPLLGEHNEEIYCRELGLSRDEFAALCNASVI